MCISFFNGIVMTDESYSLCWDNVQKLCQTRHQASTTKNNMMLWALAFGIKDRVPAPDSVPNDGTKPARDIHISNFLPNEEELISQRQRMLTIVERILVSHFPIFSECHVVEHIPNAHAETSSKKSEIVCLMFIYFMF